MADTVKQSDIDKILKDNTDELSKLFKSIQTDAFNIFKDIATSAGGLTAGFKNAEAEIKKLKTPAEQYLGIQKLQETIQGKINELKGKTGYLDATALAFKKEELKLQEQIANAQITAINQSLTLDDVAKKAAVDALKIKMIAAGAELDYIASIGEKQNEITELLEKQLAAFGAMLPPLEKQNVELDKIKEGFKGIGKELTGINIGMPTFFDLLLLIVQQFGAIENAAFAVRQNMGLLINDVGADGLYGIVQNVSNQFANIGVTAEIVGKSINSISNAFGNSAFASKEIVTNLSALEASFGISGDTSAKVLKSMMGISQSSAKSQVSMIGFAKEFSNAAGVPLTEVMKDLSTLSESVRTTFRGSTLQLVKSTVEARKLGLTITEAGNVAEKLLNFTESINAEIEASVMLGRNISFQDARTLAYKGDILGATKNILDTIEQTADLNKLDALQLKSISEASGLTVGQLQDSLQLRKDLKQLQLSGNAEAQKQVDLYNQLNGLGKYAAEMKGNEALENIKNTNNLARQKQIQAELLGLLYNVADVLMPIFQAIGKIASGLTWINDKLRVIVGETAGAWVSGIVLAGAAVLVLKSHWLSMFSSILTKIPGVSKALNAIGMGSSAAGAAGASKSFGKGAMFAAVGSFLKSLGTTATIMGAAASLYILAEALKNMPTDLGGLSIGEYMRDIAGGLLYLSGALAIMGVTIKFIAIGAGALLLMSIGLGAFGLSLQSIANPIKTFSDSFVKLTENLKIIDPGNMLKLAGAIGALSVAMGASVIGGIFGAVGMSLMIGQLNSLNKVVDPLSSSMNILADSFAKFVNSLNNTNLTAGITASKNGIKELREEIQKFKDDDLKILDKLGNFKLNATDVIDGKNSNDLNKLANPRASTSTEAEVTKKKESDYVDLTNAIVTAIRTGMSNIQITVESDGTIKRNWREEKRTVSRSGFNGVA